MTTNNPPSISLSPEARSAVWRIFGAGESLLKKKSSCDLIKPVLNKYGSHKDIQEVRGWFDRDNKGLKHEWHGPVAELIIRAIQSKFNSGQKETAVWAAGATLAVLSLPIIIHSNWSPKEIDSFVETAISVLEKACHKDLLIDARKLFHIGSHESMVARVPRSAVVHEGEGTLQTFIRLDRDSGRPEYNSCLYPVVFNLISLIIHLRPDRFQEVVKKLNHPIVQIHVACHMIAVKEERDYRLHLESPKTLEWITQKSCDSVIALAIISVLNTVKRLDDDRNYAFYQGVNQDNSGTEESTSQNQHHAAADALLHDLVARLFNQLESKRCTRWIGELLSGAPYILDSWRCNSAPVHIKQLEELCTNRLARLIFQLPWEDFLPNLRAGLCLTRRNTWTRHLADLAWEIRAQDPAKASTVAQATINEYEIQVTMELQKNEMFIYWDNYHYRAWIHGIGVCLVLAQPRPDPFTWVVEHCRQVPLSVWDIEENVEISQGETQVSFSTANHAVQHWFLVGFRAVEILRKLDQSCDLQTIQKIVELLWSHCRFARQYLFDDSVNSIASEIAACLAVEAAPDDSWLLDRARHPGAGPLVLWTMLDEHQRIAAHAAETRAHEADFFKNQVATIAQQKFRNDNLLHFESVCHWAQLWLFLEATDEAERTAIALTTFRLRQDNHPSTSILILKLLALASTRKQLSVTVINFFQSLYRQTWQYSILSEEQADREIVDRYLQESPTLMP